MYIVHGTSSMDCGGMSPIQLNLQLRELHILFDSSGAAYTAKVVSFSEEEKIQLNVWDTSGAERFDSLTKLYYRDAQV